MSYAETTGDVTRPKLGYYNTPEKGKLIVLPHVVNNIGVYNAGVAKGIRGRWPKAYQRYYNTCRIYKMCPEELLGKTELIQVDRKAQKNTGPIRIIVANMFGQHLLRRKGYTPLDYEALEEAMVETLEIARTLNMPIEFHTPKFGCGLAMGNWSHIKSIIENVWAKNYPVLVYSLGG